MATNDPQTLGELLRLFGKQLVDGIHVAMPGTIVSYSSTSRTCSVKLNSHRRLGDIDIELPVIDDVPVCFPRAGVAMIELPVTVGDPVLCIVTDRALDNWRAGITASTKDPRSHNINDAIVLPLGIYPDASAPPTTKIQIKTDGSIVIETPGNVFLGGELLADNVALAAKVNSQFTALNVALQVMKADFTGIASALAGVGGASALAITALNTTGFPSSVASIKTKAQ